MCLKNKSDINIGAAKELRAMGYYCSSVHCAYYSCLQYIKYLMIHRFGKTEEVMTQDMRNNNYKTHDYLIKEIKTRMKSNQCQYEDKNCFNQISTLKSIRVDSDYKETEITDPMAKTGLDIAEGVLRTLKKLYR